MQLCAENFTRKRARMKEESVSDHNEMHNELILFLKTKGLAKVKLNLSMCH